MISANEARQLAVKARTNREELIERDKVATIARVFDAIKIRAAKGEHVIYVPTACTILEEGAKPIYYRLTVQDFALFEDLGYDVEYHYCMDTLNVVEMSW